MDESAAKRLGRIRKNKEFQQVFQEGKSVATRGLVLYRLSNGLSINRVGFVVSKKVGNACTRNRVKRLFKEAYRANAGELLTGKDLVFIARAPAAAFDFTQAATEMRHILHRGGLFTLYREEKKSSR